MRSFEALLVTGGCGFIGVNFIRHVLARPDFRGRIINFDALTYAGCPQSLDDVARSAGERYVLEPGDVRDPARLAEVLDRHDVDGICHFAAESHVDRSIVDPDAFVQTNIVGTYHLLQAVRERAGRIKLLHHVSTDEVFGSLGPEGHFTETTPYSPRSPYSASKAASDHLVRAFHETYGVPVTVSNCSNNYGPYQFPEKLVPLMILNALEGSPLPVYGDGQNVRDWLHVRDHAVAVWTILTAAEIGRTYCVGGRCELPNLEVVRRICRLVDEQAGPLPGGSPREELITFVSDRPGHDRRYAIDCSLIEQDLGWSPTATAESGLAETVAWYLGQPDWVRLVRSGAYRTWIDRNYANRDV